MNIHKAMNVLEMVCSAVLLSGCIHPSQNALSVSSPDGRNEVSVFVDQGKLYYAVEQNGNPLLAPSRLGLRFKEHTPLGDDVHIVSFKRDSFSETWEQVWGEQHWVTNRYEELLVTLAENGEEHKTLNIRVRVYDEGFGFRYEFPEQTGLDQMVIMDEQTEFQFPADGPAWWTPGNTQYYENLTRVTPLSEVGSFQKSTGYKHTAPTEARPANLPVTIKTADGLYLAIHEANLTDYAAMNLSADSTTLKCELTPWSTGEKVFATVPFVSPWRMMIVADKPGGLIESTLELNLNEPCKIEDTSWIETGRYIGIWWAIHLKQNTWRPGEKHGATTENTMRYIDFAAQHGFKGVLVEGWNQGWETDWWLSQQDNFIFTQSYPDFDLEKVCAYALSKNVRLVGHHETGSAISNYEKQMDDAFALYQTNGVRVVKTGYAGRRASDMQPMLDSKELHASQYGVRHFQKVVETAAKYHQMIISHESIAQTGLRRTWPNMMSSENLRGQEYNAWSSDGGNPPSHLATIPFTRGLAGPIDFTPGIVNFENKARPNSRVQSTVAKQLALYVVLYSPWQMAADLPENYENHPALSFIEHVPTNWETTRVLDGAIGDFVTVARKDRNSEEWFIGSLTDENRRSIHIPLDFLDRNRNYTAEIYRDGDDADWKTNPTALCVETKTVFSADALDLTLATSGGTAIRLIPQK